MGGIRGKVGGGGRGGDWWIQVFSFILNIDAFSLVEETHPKTNITSENCRAYAGLVCLCWENEEQGAMMMMMMMMRSGPLIIITTIAWMSIVIDILDWRVFDQ